MIHEFQTTGPNGYKVLHLPETDGGGTWFGQEFIDVIKERYPNRVFDHCWEWCAGPGFIGFSILDHGLCQRLLLSDIYDPAVELSKETAKRAGVSDRVESLLFRDVALLPAHYQFDLIVANPPHEPYGTPLVHTAEHGGRIEADPGWSSHQNFFRHVKYHLAPNGVIILQENQRRSCVADFEPFIQRSGLQVLNSWPSARYFNPGQECQIYYIEIAHSY